MQSENELVNAIREEIYRGGLRPGEWLKQQDVVERYAVKPFLARKAFQILSERGLVQHEKFRGFRVALPSEKELRQLKEVRCILETGAAPAVMAAATDADVSRLRQLADEFDALIDSIDPIPPRDKNAEFHDAVNAIAGNPLLEDMIREARERQIPGALDIWISPRRIRQSAQDHHDIVDAIQRRDAEGYARLIRSHILRDIREFHESRRAGGEVTAQA